MAAQDFKVDYSVFYKTAIQKAQAYTIKKQWQATMKLYYGTAWKKHNNFPETLKDI